MKILTFSSLYPSALQPQHGVFVETRLRHVIASGAVTARVVAPVPWFPFTGSVFGNYGVYAKVPRHEQRFGIDVSHPRYPVIPKIGMSVAPFLMYAFVRPFIERMIDDGFDFDLIDAHYFYPDGVAAAMLARHFGKPITITARGTDINLVPRYPLPRQLIRWAGRRAGGLVTVCQALKDELVALGIDTVPVQVMRNGVDLDLFQPIDGAAARQALGVGSPVILSVGHLIDRKGHDLVIRALAQVPEACLLIAGIGPEEAALRRLAGELGLTDRVRFLGGVPHQRMQEIYAAADVLVLASDREGWANVLLEAMACGTPVVASNVWGTPEVVASPEAGRLISERTPDEIAKAVRLLLADRPSRDATRAYAERFSWDETTRGQIDLFASLVDQRVQT